METETLKQIVSYDPETGRLTWLPRPLSMFKCLRDCAAWNAKYAGQIAFNTTWPNGYKAGHIFKKTQLAHRVAWALATGEWPDSQIDHVNGDRSDNRLVNLRKATPEDNQKNTKQRIDNTSGVKGVDFQKSSGLWRARIVHNKRRVEIGKFINYDCAVAARKAAEREYGYHPNHGRMA